METEEKETLHGQIIANCKLHFSPFIQMFIILFPDSMRCLLRHNEVLKVIQYIDSTTRLMPSGIWYQAWYPEAETIHETLQVFKIEHFRQINAAALERDNLSLKHAAIQQMWSGAFT